MTRQSQYNKTKVRPRAAALPGPIDLFIFMAGLFGSVALLLIALVMHI